MFLPERNQSFFSKQEHKWHCVKMLELTNQSDCFILENAKCIVLAHVAYRDISQKYVKDK